ncbi:MAG: serine/threonine-protein kinase [Vicinamibacterales bacterium]
MPEVMTDPERWRRVQELCEALDEVPEAEWSVRLQALDADPSVRAEALSLRAAMRDEAAYARAETGRRPVVTEHPAAVGGVTLVGRIGAGGSGEVFRGVRLVHGTEQTVAVKRFHAHRAQGADLERIAREQRMLAALSHPDIVRLLDAGVADDGRPFLVMEFADGEPITAWCDQRRVPIPKRLRLFLAVGDAVQSAHRHLIVHLDLKPGNILVTADGRPKLLDFGTAKSAGPDVALTGTEPLTLQYASPERLRGEAVSVACDVYSLGLILYELLAGAWPYERHESLVALAERASGAADALPMSRVVTEGAAERRGTSLDRLRSLVRGDLEAITMKALAHAPADRYATVSELTDDVRRYLDGEPVRARKPGVWYPLGKFLRRHAIETVSVVLLIAGLAGATAYSLVQARASARAAERAQAQNRFLTSVFTLAGNDATSASSMTVRQLLDLADARVTPTLAALPDVAGDVERALGQGMLAQSDFAAAAALFDRARERAAKEGDRPREAAALAGNAYTQFALGRGAEAATAARTALAMWQEAPERFSTDLAVATLMTAGNTLAYVNPPSDEPAPYLEACLRLTVASRPAAGPSTRHNCLYGLAAVRLNANADFAGAERLLDEAAALQRADPALSTSLAMTQQLRGLVMRSSGRFAEDERAQREALEILERLQGADSTSALWQRAVWANSLIGAGRAEDGYREAEAVLTKARQRYPDRGAPMLWTPLSAASAAACYLERNDDCERLTLEALQTLGPDPPANDARARTARGLLGLVLARRGRLDEARPLIQAAIDGTLASRRSSIFMPRWQAALASSPR